MQSPIIKAVRAIAAEQMYRILRIGSLFVLISLIIFGVLISWLAQEFSPWWLIVIVPLSLIIVILGVVLILLRAIVSLITPRTLTRTERKQVHHFVDRLIIAASTAQISRSALAFLIIKDALKGRHFDERIRSVLREGHDLKDEYRAIENMFR